MLGPITQRLDYTGMRLSRAIPERLSRDTQRVEYLGGRIVRIGPRLTERHQARFGMAAARLEDLSPLAILARGYSASFTDDGQTVVKSIGQVVAGDRIRVRVSDGRIVATVNETIEEKR